MYPEFSQSIDLVQFVCKNVRTKETNWLTESGYAAQSSLNTHIKQVKMKNRVVIQICLRYPNLGIAGILCTEYRSLLVIVQGIP